MPYIKKNTRGLLDPAIEQLASELNSSTFNDRIAGEITYVLYRLALLVSNDKPSFARMNMLVGAFDNAKDEFKRRKLNPHEDRKIVENGDVKGEYHEVE